jgi:hypothetical protein
MLPILLQSFNKVWLEFWFSVTICFLTFKVVSLAPQHHEARRTLSTILQQLGRAEEALQTLSQGYKNFFTNFYLCWSYSLQIIHIRASYKYQI